MDPDSQPNDDTPDWAKKNGALVVWKREAPFGKLNAREVRFIDMEASYRDNDTEMPISGEDLLKKLTESEKGWRCLGIYLVTVPSNGIPCQRLKAAIARFPMLAY